MRKMALTYSLVILFVLASLPFACCVKASSELWSQTYGSDAGDICTAMIQTTDGRFVLFGFTDFLGNSSIWLVKTDAYGKMDWNKTVSVGVNKTVSGSVNSFIQTLDGGFAIAGYTLTANDYPLADFSLIKTDKQGNMLWNQTYSGQAFLGYPSLIQTLDGGFALSGSIGDWETGDFDFWLIKTDENGIIPEFRSWIILPLFLIATIVVTVYKTKLTKSS